MAQPKTKEEALRQMRLIWIAFVVSTLLYVYIGETTPGFGWLHFKDADKLFVTVAALNLLSFVWFRIKRYPSGVKLAKDRPHDIRAIRRWMNYWLVLLCSAESIAVFGFGLRMGDKTLGQTIPFYAVALLLELSLWPLPAWE